jgi:AmmeMemoRadiSam system protein B
MENPGIVHLVAGPREHTVRRPAVAGTFYPADPAQCGAMARSFLDARDNPAAVEPHRMETAGEPHTTPPSAGADDSDIGRPCGAVVPHAGWVCSGAIAGHAIRELARRASPPDLIVVFAAVHTSIELSHAALGSHEAWEMPGGAAAVAVELGESLTNRWSHWFSVDDRFHVHEHAVEVELPLIQAAWPAAQILPIEVPLTDDAVVIGQHTAEAALSAGYTPVFLASSDLTHYGPAYHFAPAGIGAHGLQWARQNDQRVLRLVEEVAAERVVPEVRAHHNACGGGAIAAMLAACRVAGARSGRVLWHANSYETLAGIVTQTPTDAVGYAAVVVG